MGSDGNDGKDTNKSLKEFVAKRGHLKAALTRLKTHIDSLNQETRHSKFRRAH